MPYQLEANCLKLPFQGYTTAHPISDRFGTPRSYGKHEGIDWACPSGTAIHAMIAGIVTKVGNQPPGLGKFVTVRTGRFTISYGHLQSVEVELEDKVDTDQLLGISGNTGNSTGPHLHVNFNPDVPVPGATVSLGAVDFQPFLPENAYDWSQLESTLNAGRWLAPVSNLSYQDDMCPPLQRDMPPLLFGRPDNTIPMHMAPDANSPVYPCSPIESCSFLIGGKDNNDWDLPYYHPDLTTSIPTPDWWQIELPSYPVCWVRNDVKVKEYGLLHEVTITHPPTANKQPCYLFKPVGVNVRSQAKTHDDKGNAVRNTLNASTINGKWCPILEMKCDETDTVNQYLWYRVRIFSEDNDEEKVKTGWVRGDVVQNVQGTKPELENEEDMPFPNEDPVVPAAVPAAWAAVAQRVLDANAVIPVNSTSEGTTLAASRDYPVVARFRAGAPMPRTWFKLRLDSGSASGTLGRSRSGRAAGSSSATHGWVPEATVSVIGNRAAIRTAACLRISSWVTAGANVRSGPDKTYDRLWTLRDHGTWYEIVGKDAAMPAWWRVEVSAGMYGWIHASLTDAIGDTARVPVQTADSPVPAETGPAHEAGTGTGTTTGSAAGDFRNLVTNPDGRWAVSKAGTTVTANFSSPRSPVQYYARQNPQPQFVLPVGFRPTATVPHTVTDGTRVNEDRTPVPNAPAASFDLTIGTNGEMRYVNNSKVDHLGYVSYSVTALKWQSNEALTTPAQPGDTEASGVYLNQQVNRGSSWELERRGNAVSGSFGCTRSPVDYFANGAHRAAQLLLPADYRPKANARFQVKGAVRVNQDGSDSTDRRKVDFWLTVQPNGEMWYDADTNLQTLGVGYLRYTVNVSWTAAPRITVPGVPRDLEAEDIEATELELDWRRPAEDGGAAIDGYRIQVWDADDAEWDTEESDTNSTRTRYDVEDLAPYTTYRFRVAAHNTAGWGAFCPAITATTRRRAPGAPASLSATATHDAVTLNWGTASGTVTGYTLARRTGNGTWDILVADTGVTTRDFVDRTVSPATTYRFRVRGHNRGEAGTWSQERSIATAAAPTIPGQVTDLAVAPGTGSRLQLTWTAPTDTGGGVTGHRIERAPDTTPRTWTVVREDTGSNTASWGDNDVTADTVYHYRVGASNSAGVGTPSAEAEGRSRPQLHLGGRLPYPLTAHASPWADASVTATFAAYLPGRAYDLTARVPDPDGWWRVLLFGQGTTSPFWLPAAAGTAAGDTAALPQPPAAPQNLAAALARGRVTLTWSAPPAGTTFTGQRLSRQRDHEAWTPLGDDLGTAVLTHVDDTVQNGHVYRYRLQALADTGPGRPSNSAALAVMATPAAPAAVAGLQATAAANTLQLAWTRAATGGLPVAYRVQWRVDGTADDFLETEVIGTAHTLTGLRPATVYDLRVVAFNQVGDASATRHTATTLPPAPGIPGTPDVAVTGQDATVTWQVPATGGPPNAYHLQAKTRATADWPDTFTTVTGTAHTLTGLELATAYDLRLRAANTTGASDWVAATFTTGPRPQLSLKTTATTGLNVRSGPGTAHARVASIAGGSTTRYDILGKDATTPTWYQIRFSDTVTGWVHGDYVQTHGDISGLTVTWTPPQLSLKATTTANLNVRSGPGTTHNVVGTITGGSTTRYDILGKNADTATWYQIRFSDTVTGWVHGDYVQTHGDLSGLAVTWTSGPQLSLKATTTLGLNVRSGAGTAYAKVGFIPGGSTTRYDILGKNAATPTWWRIQFSSIVTGWVHANYVQTHGDVSGVPIR